MNLHPEDRKAAQMLSHRNHGEHPSLHPHSSYISSLYTICFDTSSHTDRKSLLPFRLLPAPPPLYNRLLPHRMDSYIHFPADHSHMFCKSFVASHTPVVSHFCILLIEICQIRFFCLTYYSLYCTNIQICYLNNLIQRIAFLMHIQYNLCSCLLFTFSFAFFLDTLT